jgi:hypothetical protein
VDDNLPDSDRPAGHPGRAVFTINGVIAEACSRAVWAPVSEVPSGDMEVWSSC